jgi:hypothetical protein
VFLWVKAQIQNIPLPKNGGLSSSVHAAGFLFHDAKFSTLSHSMTSSSLTYYRFPSFCATPPSERTAQQYLAEILSKSDRHKKSNTSEADEVGMPAPEGKLTEPMLRVDVKGEVKQEKKGNSNP